MHSTEVQSEESTGRLAPEIIYADVEQKQLVIDDIPNGPCAFISDRSRHLLDLTASLQNCINIAIRTLAKARTARFPNGCLVDLALFKI